MHGIKVATLKSGLSPHVIRMWEKRYGAVQPERTSTNRRLYSDVSIERLQKLAQLTNNGHTISQVAQLSDDELTALVEDISNNAISESQHDASIEKVLTNSLAAIESFDQAALETIFDNTLKKLGYSGLLEKMLVPLIHKVGHSWHNGDITTAEEHAATSFIKDYLCVSARSFKYEYNAPKVLITTPPGQLHELGAVIAASLARKQGWQVVYLGVSLPPDEIAGAAEKIGARAIILSIVYPLDDPQLVLHLQRLRDQLSSKIDIIVGGAQSETYSSSLRDLGLTHLKALNQLSDKLTELRK